MIHGGVLFLCDVTIISTRMDTFFNGNNNSIRNIYIYEAGPTQVSVALFKYMGEVKNLKLKFCIENFTMRDF